MREERIATWERGNSTWGGRVGALGTVPLCVYAQEMAGVRDGFLAGKGNDGYLKHLEKETSNLVLYVVLILYYMLPTAATSHWKTKPSEDPVGIKLFGKKIMPPDK
nr:hypothetical protein [Tanacetum cinerariifolium]